MIAALQSSGIAVASTVGGANGSMDFFGDFHRDMVDFGDELSFDFEDAIQASDEQAKKLAGQVPNARLPGGGLRGKAANDFRRGTVVCRHWIRNLCMKGEQCEFLHQFDLKKMPECRWGEECQDAECPYRHVKEEDRVECVFYRQGFCAHGRSEAQISF